MILSRAYVLSSALWAKECGAVIIEINKEPTLATDLISDYLICGSAGEIIPEIVNDIRRIHGQGQGIAILV